MLTKEPPQSQSDNHIRDGSEQLSRELHNLRYLSTKQLSLNFSREHVAFSTDINLFFRVMLEDHIVRRYECN